MKCPTCNAETVEGAYGHDGQTELRSAIEEGDAYVIRPEDAFYSDTYAFSDGVVAVLPENIERTRKQVWLTAKRDFMWWEEPEWLDFCPDHGEVYEMSATVSQGEEA